MLNKHEDTYFFDAKTALREAKRSHQIPTINTRVKGLQICYYDGVPLESAPENCINVPINTFMDFFTTTKLRIPTHISFENKNFSEEMQNELLSILQTTLQQVQQQRKHITDLLVEQAKQLKPDFSQGIRVFLLTSRETTVMQFVSKNLAKAFERAGYTVKLLIEDNDMQQLDLMRVATEYIQFHPNVTVNINNLNNIYLHPDVVNFIWFQDSMPLVLNDQPIPLRERDNVYALIPGIQNRLKGKGVDAKLQDFVIDENIFCTYANTKRENKVVFIGSAYHFNAPKHIPMGLLEEMREYYISDGKFTNDYLHKLAIKHSYDEAKLFQSVLPFIIRDLTLVELSKRQTNFTLEVYGWGWEKYDELQPYYKGVLEHGKAIANVYNSAQYAIITHPNYLIQQRTLEATSCGATALVYDCRYRPEVQEPYYEDELLFFQNINELEALLQNSIETKVATTLLDEHSSLKFVESMIETVQKTLEN